MHCLKINLFFILSQLCFFSFALAQQQIQVSVSPTTSHSIKGHKELDRYKYFNLATSTNDISNHVAGERFEQYFQELEMGLGRRFQLVKAETNWGGGFREDNNRPGFMDTTFFVSRKNPSDAGLEDLMAILGSNAGIAAHDGPQAFPDFMPKYQIEGGERDEFPLNNEAAAEMIAYYLKYNYTDFQRPATFEPVNEPHWQYWSDPRFIEFHTKAKEKVDEMGINVKIGGPCYSVGNFFKKEYGNLSQLTNFMSSTNFNLDFYSFHIYDYMRWDDDQADFVGAISSGLPEEGVFDALNAWYYHQTGNDFSFVGSEHGGYLTNDENRTYAVNKLADAYFPGEGFLHEMKKRTIVNFIMVNSSIANTMTFMNHPHIVEKAVPFIILESAGWDPTYYSSLLVKENFQKSSNVWHESRLIDFYRFFKDVKGRRVCSDINDTDIQHFAFVDGQQLILLFHNQSNINGEIDLGIRNLPETPSQIMIRRLGRSSQDFLPYFSELDLSNVNTPIDIGPQESIALFLTYPNPIPEEQIIDEQIYYSPRTATQFNGSETFVVDIPDDKAAYALLRVGISRSSDKSKIVNIRLNGTELEVPIEDCADRITNDVYATTKIIRVASELLQKSNEVEVSFPDGQSGSVGAVTLRVGYEAITVNTKEQSTIQTIKIYPNPASQSIQIPTQYNQQIEIYNVNGQLVHRNQASSTRTNIDLSDFNAGVYTIWIKDGAQIHIGRFLVTK